MPDDFLVYVHGFENEAKLRGRTVDIEKQGLKVEFADFSGKDYVGLTNYENPIRIQIDKHYWNSAPDPYREFVLFHELGHAFLGINDHRNDTLPNGDWKSIMRGPPANGDEHRIDYDKPQGLLPG
ncbi:MAG: ImmA/IrrE family metallo-endopeptidase [Candidatus Moduliflexus flocculans]|nr:ImmA/IrrE family metallo-endopeptidase [Candidatus Moduliflexus flocculans]